MVLSLLLLVPLAALGLVLGMARLEASLLTAPAVATDVPTTPAPVPATAQAPAAVAADRTPARSLAAA